MKIEKVQICGFEPALRGMRNPKDSWDKSDSSFYEQSIYWPKKELIADPNRPVEFQFQLTPPWNTEFRVPEFPQIGSADMKLACKLIAGGAPHSKFLRQIVIWADLTLPRYCWQEVDTYKVATVKNSCSTMYKLGCRELDQNDFELPIKQLWLDDLNELIRKFKTAKSEKSTKIRDLRIELKNSLPEGYLQKATYMMNYETALNWLRWRSSHRLNEWNVKIAKSLCSWIISLPYMVQFAKAAELEFGD